MEYWRINSKLSSVMVPHGQYWVLSEIREHLALREYNVATFNTDKKVESPEGFVFQIFTTFDDTTHVYSIYVKNESGWKSRLGLGEPQIVRLIEDYFKVYHNWWYLIETLNNLEDSRISESGRAIKPLDIKQKIDQWEENPPRKPDIIEIGMYEYGETDFYKGSKNDFDSALEFWISCLYWVSSGELESQKEYFRHAESFDAFLGSCIPIDVSNDKEVKNVLSQIALKDALSVNPSEVLLMRKDWNDTMYLVEYKDWFVLYNWHTAE